MGESIEPLVYDDGTADALISALRLLADKLTGSIRVRFDLAYAAHRDFKGVFARQFEFNGNTCGNEATALARACGDAATAVSQAQESAHRESVRRRQAREYEALARRRDPHEGSMVSIMSPPGSPEPEPLFEAAAVRVAIRERGKPGAVSGSSGGSVGADPVALEAFAAAAEGVDREAINPVPRVSGALTDYEQNCRWGHVKAASIVAAAKRWAEENDADRVWARQVAAAFIAAGGHADIATVRSVVEHLSGDQWSAVGNALVMVILKDGSAEEIKSFFQANPAALKRFQDNPPPADQVRSWWGGLTPAVRDRLTTAAPDAIGNLAGVPYRARDTANRHWLDTELRTAESDLSDATTALQGVREDIGAKSSRSRRGS